MEFTILEAVFTGFSFFMLKFAWDLTSYAKKQDPIKSEDYKNSLDEQLNIRRKINGTI